MKLSNIIKGMKCKEIINFVDRNIECITHNSKDVIEDTIFFALHGQNDDGVKYIDEACKKGAKVLVSDKKLGVDVTNIVVDDVRIAMSIMAKNFYGRSDEKLQIIAIVGTNGKTTSSCVLANMLTQFGKKVGVVGTNGIYIGNDYLPSNLTTPDPIDLHYIFNQMVSFGIEIVIMEVSAHAIYYNKIYGIKFDVGLYTNITNEHLDFFKTMDNYAKTKMSIFDKKYMKECVVNIDDNYGVSIAKHSNIPVVSYGIYNPANIFAVDVSMSIVGSKFFVNVNDDILKVDTKLIGEYNIYNILGCIGVAKLLGADNESIVKALRVQENVAGRFNVFDLADNKKIIVDFAHTPDGFEKVLSLIKKLRKGKIITIFGCVGYSDKQKRIIMGEVANKYSDEIIISTDNIGYASFDEVCDDIVTNIPQEKVVAKIFDRAEAIELAIKNMKKNDTLVILGKGCENKQVVKGEALEYSDIEVVKNLIKEDCSD